jgi:hypothetical protein
MPHLASNESSLKHYLFIFSLFSHYTSACIGLASCPSGGNIVYMQQIVRVVRLSCLSPDRPDAYLYTLQLGG